MRIPRIYYAGSLSPDGVITLPKDSSHHLVKVLRLVPPHPLVVFNGQGGEYAATLCAVQGQNAEITVGAHRTVAVESPLAIHLGQGIARGEKMDLVIQKSVELGVARITPLFTARCGVKLDGARLEKRLSHWQAVAIGACEQSGRVRVPQIAPPEPLEQWVKARDEALRLILDPTAGCAFSDLSVSPQSVALLIGPEGGFCGNEIHLAQGGGFVGVTLGPRVLRTETASLAALMALQCRWGDC